MNYRLLRLWGLLASIFPLLVGFFQPLADSNTVTFHPPVIPISGTELINPLRGYYERRGVETVPLPETALDTYNRYYWYDPDHPEQSLEPAPGEYNFASIDADMAEAAARGSKFAFRIRAMADDDSGKRFIPDYLSDCGWDYRGTFIPDWNGACFLENAARLLNALGARYDGDPHIAWIDIGLYGRAGSWAFNDDMYYTAPDGFYAVTDETMVQIVQMHLDAFPQSRKVMTAKTRAAAVIRALASSDGVGWRADCLGREGFFDFPRNPKYAAAWPYMQDRWKTAPVIAEFCTGNVDATYNTAMRQVREFHITAIGNGSVGAWERKNARQQDTLLQIGKISGYRFQISEVTAPKIWQPGSTAQVTARWENVGVSPHYEPTLVLFQLYDRINRRYVWGYPSTVNLETLLPTGDAPVVAEDRFPLPVDLPEGAYELRVSVIDPQFVRRPLNLALASGRTDGSYRLGTVWVGRSQ